MAGLRFCGAVLAASWTLVGCSTFHSPGPSVSYAVESVASRQIAEDLVQSLSEVYMPAKTVLFMRPERIRQSTVGFIFQTKIRKQADKPFSWELEHAMRQRGFAVQVDDTEPGLPVTYVVDRIGKSGYLASLCVEQDWCVSLLYQQQTDGTLLYKGGTTRTQRL